MAVYKISALNEDAEEIFNPFSRRNPEQYRYYRFVDTPFEGEGVTLPQKTSTRKRGRGEGVRNAS